MTHVLATGKIEKKSHKRWCPLGFAKSLLPVKRGGGAGPRCLILRGTAPVLPSPPPGPEPLGAAGWSDSPSGTAGSALRFPRSTGGALRLCRPGTARAHWQRGLLALLWPWDGAAWSTGW